jgi:formylglycine-generating enzyme required for sulfatase activity
MAIDRDFWAAEFPLTVAVVRQFLDSLSADCDPAEDALRRDRSFAAQARRMIVADDLPAVDLSLADVEVLCAWMHRMDGRQYRLPTEAEWEHMARAGTSGSCWWAAGVDRDRSAEGAQATKSPGPSPPAVFGCNGPRPADPARANPWGLIDVLGNVWEWTSSAYGPIAPGTVMSAGGVLSGEARTVRGGSWRSRSLTELRVSARLSMCRRTRAGDLGVRLVCDVEERSQ